MKKSKRYIANAEKVEKTKVYSVEEAIKLVKGEQFKNDSTYKYIVEGNEITSTNTYRNSKSTFVWTSDNPDVAEVSGGRVKGKCSKKERCLPKAGKHLFVIDCPSAGRRG